MILRIAAAAEGVPLLGGLLATIYRWHFNRVRGHARLFDGVYPDFATAAAAIPRGELQGYDNAPSSQRLCDERFRICASDYPVMFWLGQLMPRCSGLFDWGGNVGTSYFGYRKYLTYPDRFDWLVNDVPAVVAAGEAIAASEDTPGLRFTASLTELADSDLLLAAGSLHFVADPLADLARQPSLPRHVLLNKVPIYDLPAAVTLQNIGTAFCPNHLFNRVEFVLGFEKLGYELIDEWRAPDLSCRIPFYRAHSIPAYSGYYFRRRGADAPSGHP